MAMLTPLHEWHAAHARLMHEFAGWDMPIEYGGILKEHVAVRTSAGLFDVSHMGRLRITGISAEHMLQYILTNDVSQLQEGRAQYSFLVKRGNEGRPLTLDDVYLYRVGAEEYLLVVNAANAAKDITYLSEQSRDFGVTLEDITQSTALVAVQGPLSRQMLEQALGSISIEKPNMIQPARFNGSDGWLSTTGYTGEHTRLEAFVPAACALRFWEALVESGAEPIGLGARNTLRIEAGLLLYGHDINEGISPIEAGMGFAVKSGKNAVMIGKQFYEAQQELQRSGKLGSYLVQLELSQPRGTEPRTMPDGTQGAPSTIIVDGQTVGEITSGTVAPMVLYKGGEMLRDENGSPRTARRGLAIGYSSVPILPKKEVRVLVRGEGKPVPAVVMTGFIDKRTPLVIDGLQYTVPESHYNKQQK